MIREHPAPRCKMYIGAGFDSLVPLLSEVAPVQPGYAVIGRCKMLCLDGCVPFRRAQSRAHGAPRVETTTLSEMAAKNSGVSTLTPPPPPDFIINHLHPVAVFVCFSCLFTLATFLADLYCTLG